MNTSRITLFVALFVVVLAVFALPAPAHAAKGDWFCTNLGVGCEDKPAPSKQACDWLCQLGLSAKETAPKIAPAVQPAGGVSSPFTSGDNNKAADAYKATDAYRQCTAAHPGFWGALQCLGQ